MITLSPVMALLQMESDPNAGSAAGAAVGGVVMLIWLAFVVLMFAALWKIFVKAGEPGWAAIIPIYNIIVMLKIAGKPAWWVILMLIPVANIIVGFLMCDAIAKRFGKGTGFAIGMLLLPFIFYPVLAWGDNRYSAAATATA